jgi:hypothetical protein
VKVPLMLPSATHWRLTLLVHTDFFSAPSHGFDTPPELMRRRWRVRRPTAIFGGATTLRFFLPSRSTFARPHA